LTEIKASGAALLDADALKSMGVPMSTSGILFLVLVLAAGGIFAGVLAYYSRG